jgi:hypothetical protein
MGAADDCVRGMTTSTSELPIFTRLDQRLAAFAMLGVGGLLLPAALLLMLFRRAGYLR